MYKKKCIICGCEQLSVVYEGEIRTGSLEMLYSLKNKDNSLKFDTSSGNEVFQCGLCQTKFLSPEIKKFSMYGEEEKIRPEKLRNLYDEYQNDRISRIGIQNFRDKIVADFGGGAGYFLDTVYGFCKKSIAIEPALYLHPELERKHRCFSNGKELVDSGIRIDIATAFEVIEHVEDPVAFLREIRETLDIGGKLYLTTPNDDDILNDLVAEEFSPFYYRTEHLYYFNKESMDYIFRKAGFAEYKIGFYHRFDISNLLFWLKLGKPTGLNKYPLFDKEFNSVYRQFLEKKERQAIYGWKRKSKPCPIMKEFCSLPDMNIY